MQAVGPNNCMQLFCISWKKFALTAIHLKALPAAAPVVIVVIIFVVIVLVPVLFALPLPSLLALALLVAKSTAPSLVGIGGKDSQMVVFAKFTLGLLGEYIGTEGRFRDGNHRGEEGKEVELHSSGFFLAF